MVHIYNFRIVHRYTNTLNERQATAGNETMVAFNVDYLLARLMNLAYKINFRCWHNPRFS
jgi:hypothetical protein